MIVALKTRLKNALIWLYCRGRLSLPTTQKLFDLFNLKGL